MSESLKHTKNNLSPSITDTIKVDNQAFDLTGSTVSFRMRAAKSSTLKVDAAATIVTATEGKVRYDWGAADVDTAGEFYSWWRITLPSAKIQETNESLIIFDEHTDGLGVSTGAIAERVKAIMPSTYKSLESDVNFGDIRLQQKIDLVKFKLFATNIAASLEESTYNPMIQEWIAKISAIKIIPSAIDYYKDQHQTVTTTGTSETASYPDRLKALWDLRDKLVFEVEEERPEIMAMVTITVRKKGTFPKVDTSADDLLTTDPKDFWKQFADPEEGHLPWVISG